MNVELVYPWIASKPEVFRPMADRFMQTLLEGKAGSKFSLRMVECDTATYGPCFYPEPYLWSRYRGGGRDIGAHIHAANEMSTETEFAVFCSSQVYFHRDGWLKRLVEAREQHGPGLYGAMASYENSPHIRTCFFGCDPGLLQQYPRAVTDRRDSLSFESGAFSFSDWVRREKGLPVMLVTWDETLTSEHWRSRDNIFRRGDQSNCLVFDRHTDLYAAASPEEKATLEQLADGKA